MENFLKMREHGLSGYYKTKKLSNGQTAFILFFDDSSMKTAEYSVIFTIANKKKQIREWLTEKRDVLSLKSTGDCGLEGLIWAKQQLLEFEEYAKNSLIKKGKVIVRINWADNRRRNVYERGLKKLGYQIGIRHGYKCLYKAIKKEQSNPTAL